ELVEEFTAGYWAEQVRGTVRFADAVNRLGALGVTRFVELGPDAHLTGAITETCDDETVLTVPALRRNRDEPDTLMRALAHLWADGTEIDWHAFYAPTDARVTDLPTYAFQRKRYWPTARLTAGPLPLGSARAGHPLLQAVITVAGSGDV